ncbi:MAG TPA: glycosyltransferase, partial [Oligoflexia bacterium]|nr:glycosyltransferase [Oligoflexia bacterium]
IIVADAASTDRTAEIAQGCGAKVVPGGLPPAGRNNAARAASGDYLFFADADVVFPPGFLTQFLRKVETTGADAASCFFVPRSSLFADAIIQTIFNFYNWCTQFFYPHAQGAFIFSKRWLHERISGFDETIFLGEDHDYVRRAQEHGVYKYFASPRLPVSVRRFEKDGRLRVFLLYCRCEWHRILCGEIRKSRFTYDYGHSSPETKLPPP